MLTKEFEAFYTIELYQRLDKDLQVGDNTSYAESDKQMNEVLLQME